MRSLKNEKWYILSSVKQIWKSNDQHVTSVGQRTHCNIAIADPSMSHMNLVYGLALHDFAVAQVDGAPASPPARCLGGHRFESCRDSDFFLCPTLLTRWSYHFNKWGVRGERGRLQPPPKFWATQFLGAARENLDKASFLRRLHGYLIILKTWILIRSRHNNPVTFTRDSGHVACDELFIYL